MQQGLFGNEALQSPADFGTAFTNVLADCKSLLKQITTPYDKRQVKKKTVALLDDVSNRICTIADLVVIVSFLCYSRKVVASV